MLTSTIIYILSFCWLTAGVVFATDYCSTKLCSGGRRHIACNNTGSFSSVCPEGETQMVTMTNSLIQAILSNHNSKRELIASGGLEGFDPATNMKCMQWDDELAQLAELNLKTCEFKHDHCHNTFKFKPSGQNLAKLWWKGIPYSDDEVILSRIDTWWLEYKNTNMSHILAYLRITEKMIGHFTVMTAEENSFVGCGAIKFPDKGMSSLTFACNYAATNMIGMPMYRSGPTASRCTSGTSPDYPSLCL